MLLNNSSLKKNLIFGALLAASAALVIAGDGGQEFEAVYEMIEGWATGTLGKIIALAALIVGIGFGLVRQSVIAAVIGISMALVLNFGPSVISNILTATGEVDMAGVAPRPGGYTPPRPCGSLPAPARPQR